MATLGAELITNPGFYIVITPWVIEGFEWVHNTDVMEYTDYGIDDTFYQTISITSGKEYQIRTNIGTASAGGGSTLEFYLGGTLAGTLGDGDTGWHNITGTAGSNGKIEVTANGVDSFSDYFEIYTVGVKEIISDEPDNCWTFENNLYSIPPDCLITISPEGVLS